jgi:protein O-GlcNAc transferase
MEKSDQLQHAIQLHQSGRLQEAREIYSKQIAQYPEDAGAHHFLGLLEHQSGNLQEASRLMEASLQKDSSQTFFLVNYGNLLKDLGRPEESEKIYKQAISINPGDVTAHYNLGYLYQLWGRLEDALDCFRRATGLQPDFLQAWNKVSAILLGMDRVKEARQAAQVVVQHSPGNAAGWFHLADCQGREKQWDESCQSLEKALQIQPFFPEAHNNLGMAFQRLGRKEQARQAFLQSMNQDPKFPDPCVNMGQLYQESGDMAEAFRWLCRGLEMDLQNAQSHFVMGNFLVKAGREAEGASHLRQALSLKPDFAEALNNLGNVLLSLRQHKEGMEAFQKAIAIRPDYHEAYANLGNLHRECKFPDLAEEALVKAIQMKPDFAAAHSNLGNAYFDQGKIDQAIESYKKGIDLGQDDQEFVPNYLFALNYGVKLSAEEIGAEHRRLCIQKYDALTKVSPAHTNTRDPNRKIRIGYVSPDFWMHPVARFMLPVLQHHDRENFEIFAYYTRLLRDGITEECKSRVDFWRDTHGKSDEEMAALIRNDQIDILVDLTMHSRDCKPGLFARKPAPVQVSYLAYAGTTGLEAIKYRLTDIYLDPPGKPTPGFHEEPLRLPFCWWSFQLPPEPHVRMPEVEPAPCIKNGFITFGSLNNFVKVNTTTRETWARIVAGVPGSHLLFHMKESRIRDEVLQFFASHGVSSDRITIIGYQNGPDYIRSYHNIDIALDPFPFAGGTTTFDAIWMGVPVVTLAGDRPVGRGGLSILSTLGHPEWVGKNLEDYARVAKDLASNHGKLATIRQNLRDEIKKSPLMDSPRFVREMEKHFRQIWKKWCEQPADRE